MFNILSAIMDPIAKVTNELINTPLEKAQAQAIKLKAIDPNGKMRREISKATMHLYKLYIYIMLILLLSQAFGLGEPTQIEKAISSMVELFLPITGAFGTIMTATFGVNATNTYKEK